MKTPNYRSKPGFTLIEMMTVVFIMVILAALGVGGMGLVTQRQNKAKAQVDIALLSAGIQSYHSDMGEYPGIGDDNADHTTTDNYSGDKPTGIAVKQLYDKLFLQGYKYNEDPANPPADWEGKSTEIYVSQLDPTNKTQTLVNISSSERNVLIRNNDPGDELYEIVDPWKRPYLYRKGSDSQNPDFDLWSAGKDGKTDYTNPDKKIEANADDLRNF